MPRISHIHPAFHISAIFCLFCRFQCVIQKIPYDRDQIQLFQKIQSEIITQGNPDEISLIENIQREDLNPLEEAEALERMMARYHYTQEELGKVIGKAQNTVSETLQLNNLPSLIKEDYRTSDNRAVSKSALIELTRIKDSDRQQIIWESMKRGQWLCCTNGKWGKRSLME